MSDIKIGILFHIDKFFVLIYYLFYRAMENTLLQQDKNDSPSATKTSTPTSSSATTISKNPLIIKIIVLLICIYGVINLTSNFIATFYLESMGGWINLNIWPFFNLIGFIIISIPTILLLHAAPIIWERKRLGFWVSIVLLVLSIPAAIGGLYYLFTTVPKVFSEDLLYLTKPPEDGMTWFLDDSVQNNAYTQSLLIERVLIVKSLLKAVIEVISLGLLSYIVINYKSFFKI